VENKRAFQVRQTLAFPRQDPRGPSYSQLRHDFYPSGGNTASFCSYTAVKMSPSGSPGLLLSPHSPAQWVLQKTQSEPPPALRTGPAARLRGSAGHRIISSLTAPRKRKTWWNHISHDSKTHTGFSRTVLISNN
jgi:hypothetical protein